MKKYFIILLAFIGIAGLFASCEKDGDKITMLEDVVEPQITTFPADLTFTRAKGASTIEFVGTTVNPGFNASATYFLEACAAGNNFVNKIVLFSGVKAESIQLKVSDVNQALLKNFAGDATHSIDFRLRSVLVVDGGTGANEGKVFEHISAVTTKSVALYGLPKLDLQNSGKTQKVVSPGGDGKYTNYVKLDKTQAFTLKDPDTNKEYCMDGDGTLKEGTTPGITSSDNGWYKLEADIVNLTYKLTPFMLGIAGSSAPNGWDGPNQKMDFDDITGTWSITIDLIPGMIKFRANDGWAWNMGLADSGVAGELKQGGVGNDIPVTEAGTFTIVLTIISDAQGTYTITKN